MQSKTESGLAAQTHACYSSPASNIARWRDEANTKILLVTADPGCDKPTLVHFAVDAKLPFRGQAVIYYFFFKDDAVLQRSLHQALCAILHQNLIKDEESLTQSPVGLVA